MIEPERAAAALVAPVPRWPGRVRNAVVAVMLVMGVAATGAAWRSADNATARADLQVMDEAEALIAQTAQVVSAGLSGISAAVRADGTVDDLSFTAYVREALPASTLSALAYEPVVAKAERAAFEAAIGRPITDRDGGAVTVAPVRDVHLPVKQVAPATDPPSPLIGFDLAGDPVRKAAAELARDTGAVVFSEPVPSQPSGSVSFFVIKALYRPGAAVETADARRAAVVGYVSTAYQGAALLERLTGALPEGTRLVVDDGAVNLGRTERAPKAADGAVRDIVVLNRTWTLRVDDPRGPDRSAVWLLGLTTVGVGFVLLYLLQRARNYDEEVAGATSRAALLATLAQELSAAMTEDEVGRIATTLGRMPIEADATSIGVIEGGFLRVHHGDTVPPLYRDGPELLPLDGSLAFTACVLSGEALIFPDEAAYRARFPDRAGTVAMGARAMLPLRRTDGTTIGAIAHLWEAPRSLSETERATLRTVADLVGQAIERSRLALAQAEDARHSEDLAALAQGLAVRTNSDAVMTFLTEAVLAPLDAMHAAVGVIDGDQLRRHYTPGPLADLTNQHLPPAASLSDATPLTDAARTGEPVLIDDHRTLHGRYPHLEEAWLGVGFGATANVPLRDRTGTIIGALGVAWDHPMTFDAEMRSRLATVAGIAGQTLERAELVDRIRRDARRSEALADFAAILATARTSPQVAAAMVTESAAVVGADRTNVALYGSGADRTVYLHLSPDAEPRIREQYATLDPERPTPHLEVLRDGGMQVYPTYAALVERFPHLLEDVGPTDIEATATIALQASNGLRIGAIQFVWDRPMDFEATDLAALRNVADLCSQALERSQLSDAEHRLVTSLQDSVLVPLPQAEGFAAAGRYLPAARSVGMGGDWFEGIVLPDGRFVTVVGDIAGHGIQAVGKMAQLRSVIGALATLDTSLDELFPLATTVGPVHDLTIASAVITSIDPAFSTMRYSCAGHPPPIVRMPDGEVVVLEEGRQPLLGIPMTARPAGDHPFPVGATLVCYTDGLIERRGETIDDAVERLAALVRELDPTLSVEELADAILLRCVPNRDQTDDVALVVVTRTG